MNKVAVIIVNWNTGKLLTQCVQSLLALPEQELIESIVVIDNASSDTSLTQLRSHLTNQSDSRVHIITSSTNLGFARANNVAIAQHVTTTGNTAPHILLLNPDTLVTAGAITALLTTLENNPHYGIVGPKLHNPDGTLQPSIRRFPTLPIMVTFFLKLGRLLPKTSFGRRYLASDYNYNQAGIVDQVMGAAFLIRNTTWQQVGPLDEAFWIWFEEVDYCRRAKNAGWDVAFMPTASVMHVGGSSFGQLHSLQRSLPFLKTAWRYSAKHLSLVTTILLTILFPVAIIVTLPASFKRSK